MREYARIQSFPDDWEFAGSMANQYKQIGNAVPVNMGYHVGRAILAMMGEGDPSSFVEGGPLSKEDLEGDALRKAALSFD